MKVLVKNEMGMMKSVKVGFSWTTFFFGVFVPLFRGDVKWFLIMLVANICTFGLAQFLFIFKYNEWYLNDLKEKGYKVVQ